MNKGIEKVSGAVLDEFKKIIMENFPNSHGKIFARARIRKKINRLFLPCTWTKYLVLRIQKFGFSRTAKYYIDGRNKKR